MPGRAYEVHTSLPYAFGFVILGVVALLSRRWLAGERVWAEGRPANIAGG